MTIIQKIKKWHVVVFAFLVFMGNWVSQNMWVFEKPIPVEEYEEFLIGTEWKSERRASIWSFGVASKFSETSTLNESKRTTGEWIIKKNIIVTNTNFKDNTEWQIIRFNRDELIIRLLSHTPRIKYKLVKIK